MARLRDRLEFARHIPPRKIAARLRLTVLRKLADRGVIGTADVPTKCPAADAPLPPMPPRRGIAEVGEGRLLALTFLHRRIAFPEGEIDWNAPSLAPADQLWRMNLHYMEYLEEVDDPLFQTLVRAWIAGNDPPRSSAWRDAWNSYALSLRAAVWMQQFALRRERLDPAFREAMLASLTRQLVYLRRHLETDLGGNHLIKNIKALMWAGAFFEDATEWRELGECLARREFPHQVLADGMHEERSPSYHSQVTVDLLEVLHAGVSEHTRQVLAPLVAPMIAALQATTHPDGQVALFNDAGLHMSYPPEAIVAAAARLDLAPAKAPADGALVLREAGYFGWRAGDDYFLADCGPIGPDDLPGHGHGDVLSFELSIGGRRIVVDQGVFRYFEGEPRLASKCARNHNTLALPGVDQGAFYGSFRCGRRPDATVEDLRTDRGLRLTGCHNGFAAAPGNPVHRRRFEVGPGALTVVDTLTAPVPGATIGFLLHPNVAVSQAKDNTLMLTIAGRSIHFSSDAAVTVKDAVYWPDMGCELATRRLMLTPDTYPVTTRFRWQG